MKQILRITLLFLGITGGLMAQNSAAVRFVRNQGQWEAAVRYCAEIPGGYLLLKEKSLMYVFFEEEALKSVHARKGAPNARKTGALNGHAVEVLLRGQILRLT